MVRDEMRFKLEKIGKRVIKEGEDVRGHKRDMLMSRGIGICGRVRFREKGYIGEWVRSLEGVNGEMVGIRGEMADDEKSEG